VENSPKEAMKFQTRSLVYKRDESDSVVDYGRVKRTLTWILNKDKTTQQVRGGQWQSGSWAIPFELVKCSIINWGKTKGLPVQMATG